MILTAIENETNKFFPLFFIGRGIFYLPFAVVFSQSQLPLKCKTIGKVPHSKEMPFICYIHILDYIIMIID